MQTATIFGARTVGPQLHGHDEEFGLPAEHAEGTENGAAGWAGSLDGRTSGEPRDATRLRDLGDLRGDWFLSSLREAFPAQANGYLNLADFVDFVADRWYSIAGRD